MASRFGFDGTGIAEPELAAQREARRPGRLGVREAQIPSDDWAFASRDTALVVRLIGGSALMALGLLVFATSISAMLFIPHLLDAVALLGAHFFSADDLIRRDMAQDLAFEAAFAWTLVFLAILFLRGPAPRGPVNPTPEGGDHGR